MAIVGVAAAVRLGFAFEKLLFPTHRWDAVDLRMRWREVQAWFEGMPVYGAISGAVYPPGSYALFWPFIGWVDFRVARGIWAVLTLALLAWWITLLVRESGAPRGPLRAAILLLPCVGYASYSTIANGQVSLLVVTCLTGGILTLVAGRGWRRDVLGSSLVAVSLIKPTLSVPIVWVAFLAPRRIRPVVLIVIAYFGLTVLAAAFQPVGFVDLMRGWLNQRDRVSAAGLDLQALMRAAGLQEAFLPVILAVLLSTGWWVYRHRGVDVWLLLGVTSIVALLWSYHRPFDDLLMWLPTVALVRVAFTTSDPSVRAAAAGLAFALAILTIERPQVPWNRPTHGLLYLRVDVVVHALNNVRVAIWLAALAFLVREARRAAYPGEARSVQPAPAAAGATDAARLPAADARGTGRWVVACLGLVLAVLSGAFAWLALDHATVGPSNIVGRESDFLREIPTVLAMALFLASTYGTPAGWRPDRTAARAPKIWVPALLAAGLLVVATAVLVSLEVGAREAARTFSRLYTRDDGSALGSHWQFHWLSTLWFALATPLAAWFGYRFLGGPAPNGSRRSTSRRIAWLYFVGLTVALSFGFEPFFDPRFIGPQARDIVTHAVTTLPLGLGLIALVHRVLGVTPGASSPDRLGVRIVAVLAIPAYLAVAGLLGESMATGQTDRGLAAMLAAHFVEHVPDYVLTGLLVVGFEAGRLQRPVWWTKLTTAWSALTGIVSRDLGGFRSGPQPR